MLFLLHLSQSSTSQKSKDSQESCGEEEVETTPNSGARDIETEIHAQELGMFSSKLWRSGACKRERGISIFLPKHAYDLLKGLGVWGQEQEQEQVQVQVQVVLQIC